MIAVLVLMISSPILLLMVLKLMRTAQEARSARAGYITFGGDDQYQARNMRNYIHDAVMIARVALEMPKEEFRAVITRVEGNYLHWYKDLLATIRDKPEDGEFETPLEIWDEYREYTLGDSPLLAKIIFCEKEQIILLVGNHTYLGGYLLSQFVQLVFCKSLCKAVFPRNKYLPVVSELMMLALFGQVTFRPRRVKAELFENTDQIRRFYLKRDLAEIKAKSDDLEMHHLYLVIAEHVYMVMQHMHRDRLRVTLPVSFSDDTTFNTVGAMFLEIEAEPDMPTMARKIRAKVKRSQWQVSASNHIQRIFPTRRLSENARNMVDLTLTVVPEKTLPDNLLAEEMKDYEFTMDNIHYPVYVMAFIFQGHVHSSFMVNTPTFDGTSFIEDDGAVPMDLTLTRQAQ